MENEGTYRSQDVHVWSILLYSQQILVERGPSSEFRKDYQWHWQAPLIIAAHGTDLDTGLQIASTGFAVLASLDSGFYGRGGLALPFLLKPKPGIYLTTHACYAYLYSRSKAKPALLVSLVSCGNPWPVSENPHVCNPKACVFTI